MYFISFLTDVLTMTNLHYPKTFNSTKFYVLGRFSEDQRDNSNFRGNLSYFTLCLRENLTMTNFLHYPPPQLSSELSFQL